MQVFELSPNDVFKFFDELLKIPHPSKKTDKIQNYLIDFANARNLKVKKDNAGNIVISKDATSGKEDIPPIALQGHIDMVCAKTPDTVINMDTEGIRAITDGRMVYADGTTLGADNAIAMAYMLAILDSSTIPHPPLEALFTNDEEVGMLGAKNLDKSLISAKRMINLDSEEEGILTVSCAGGIRALCTVNITKEENEFKDAFKISVEDLLGGHSGIDIDKNRENAICVLFDILNNIPDTIDFNILKLLTDGKVNVIAPHASAIISCPDDKTDMLNNFIKSYTDAFLERVCDTEPYAKIKIEKCTDNIPKYSIGKRDLAAFVSSLPNGVIASDNERVISSLNLGFIDVLDSYLTVGFLIRSNDNDSKFEICNSLHTYVINHKGTMKTEADYPAWEYKKDSVLRDTMSDVYTKMYSSAPQILSIHAGLECGLIADKIGDLDIVSFGPNLYDVHTPNEKMDVASVGRMYEYLKNILNALN